MTVICGLAGELAALDATAQAALVRRGELQPAELVTAAIERIEELNPQLNAVVTTAFDRAVESAAGSLTGPFAGVPYLVKDLGAEVRGMRLTEGSRFLREHVSTFDSELVVRLRGAGLVIVGKTNTCEFGMSPTVEPARFGPTRNPWDPARSTSGSSGGSAAAVAAGMVPMAHANDAGGSIRFPAAACGVFGLKPTRARNPLGPEYGELFGGLLAEHAVTRSVRDSAALLDTTAGPAPGDPYPAPRVLRPFAAEVGVDPGRLRIAYSPRTPSGAVGHPDCLAALDDAAGLCESLGHDVEEADLPGLDRAVADAIGTMWGAAVAWLLGDWVRRLGREPEPGELEPLTLAYWEEGRSVDAASYLLALDELRRFARRVAAFLTRYDMWLTPTMSRPPVSLGEITSTVDDPLRAQRNGAPTVEYPAIVANICGNPAMSVPLHWNSDGLPIGVHFLGRFGDEATLIRLASQLEQARPWATRTPPISSRLPERQT